MADVVSPAKRSQMMSGIKGKNSLPEMLVRKALFAMGHRFRLHRRDLPGTPDIAIPGRKIAIFVHGCFWHAHQGCKYAKTPSTRTEFWSTKLQGNVERDQRAVDKLAEMGWRVLNVWECSTREPAAATGLAEALGQWIDGDARFGEISAQSLAAARQA
jgi:DNA mismatch endonuclease, patch repair protein